MKSPFSVRIAVLGAVLVFAYVATAAAQPRYNKATEVTIAGTVDEVQPHQGRAGGTGTHLIVSAPGGPFDVHLGPTNWLTSKKFNFSKGDQIEIVGSKTVVDGKDAFIAREVKRAGDTMVLRDEAGFPLWAGGRRGR